VALPTNNRPGWEDLPGDKHSSLSQTLINYGREMFYNIWPRWMPFMKTYNSTQHKDTQHNDIQHYNK